MLPLFLLNDGRVSSVMLNQPMLVKLVFEQIWLCSALKYTSNSAVRKKVKHNQGVSLEFTIHQG